MMRRLRGGSDAEGVVASSRSSICSLQPLGFLGQSQAQGQAGSRVSLSLSSYARTGLRTLFSLSVSGTCKGRLPAKSKAAWKELLPAKLSSVLEQFSGPGAGPLYWQQHQNGPGKAALLEHSARGIQGEPSRCLERANVAESRASSALRAPCLRLQLPVHVLVALVPRIHDTREDKEDCSGILPGAQQGFNIKAGLGQVASRRSRHGRREAHRAPRAALGRTGRGHRDTGPRPSQGYCKAARRSRQRRRRLPERWRGTPGPEFQRIWSRSKLGRQSHHRLWNSTWLRGSELRSGRGPRQEHVLLEASQVPFVGRKKRREVLASLLPPPWPLHQEVFPSPTVRPGQLLTSMARSWEHTHHIETTPTTLRADRH